MIIMITLEPQLANRLILGRSRAAGPAIIGRPAICEPARPESRIAVLSLPVRDTDVAAGRSTSSPSRASPSTTSRPTARTVTTATAAAEPAAETEVTDALHRPQTSRIPPSTDRTGMRSRPSPIRPLCSNSRGVANSGNRAASLKFQLRGLSYWSGPSSLTAPAKAVAATQPLAQAHWKLNPPIRPSTSRISPTR